MAWEGRPKRVKHVKQHKTTLWNVENTKEMTTVDRPESASHSQKLVPLSSFVNSWEE